MTAVCHSRSNHICFGIGENDAVSPLVETRLLLLLLLGQATFVRSTQSQPKPIHTVAFEYAAWRLVGHLPSVLHMPGAKLAVGWIATPGTYSGRLSNSRSCVGGQMQLCGEPWSAVAACDTPTCGGCCGLGCLVPAVRGEGPSVQAHPPTHPRGQR